MGDFLKGAQSSICALKGEPVNANIGNFKWKQLNFGKGKKALKKGSFMLAILLIAEFIFVFKLNMAFPASIIGWSGKIEWEMLIYWIVHVLGLYMIGQVFF